MKAPGKQFFLFSFLLLVGVCLPLSASAAALYFNGASSDDWDDIGNWWQDSGFTTQADALPGAGDDVFVTSSVRNISADPAAVNSADFSNGAIWDTSGNGLTITVANGAVFHDTSAVTGVIDGDATFNDSSSDSFDTCCGNTPGTIMGNATFNNSNGNTGNVQGNATFNGSAYNAGTVVGAAKFSSASGATISISSGGQWGNGTAGSIIGNDDAPITSWIFNGTGLNNGTVLTGAVFNGGSVNNGTVSGDATFNATSSNAGAVTGNATFNSAGYNRGAVTGTAKFT